MKNLKQSIVIMLSLVCSIVFSQTNSFDELKSRAKNENKNILIYFSGSDWCGPCIKLKNKYIETDAFKSFANENLFVYNADFPRKKANQLSKEKTYENEKMADLYNPSGNFPMLVLLNSTGKVLKKWEGLPAVSLEEFIKQFN